MAKRKKRSSKKDRTPFFDDLSPHAKQAIGAVGFIVLGVFIGLSLLGSAGMVGTWAHTALVFLFGTGAYLAPLVCAFYVYALLRPKNDESVSTSKVIGIAMMFIASLAFIGLFKEGGGGIAGTSLKGPLSYFFGDLAGGIVIGAVLLIGMFLTFNTGLRLPRFSKKEVADVDEEDFVSLEDELASDQDDPEDTAEEPPEEEAVETKPPTTIKEKLGIKDTPGTFVVSNFVGPYDPPATFTTKQRIRQGKERGCKS